MKLNKMGIFTLLLFGIVIGLTGISCADPGVNATQETQSLSTVTSTDVIGLFMVTDAGIWTLTDDPNVYLGLPTSITDPIVTQWPGYGVYYGTDRLRDYQILQNRYLSYQARHVGEGKNFADFLIHKSTVESENVLAYQALIAWLLDNNVIEGGIHTGALDPGQVQYTTAYDANIVAQGGHTVFTKSTNLDTRNKVTSQSNLQTQTGLTFVATDNGGNAVGSENLMLDGAGDTIPASDRMLCPFVSVVDAYIPTFCNIVQSGSKYDLTIGSVTTSANERFVGTDSTDAVVMNYAINIKPYGTSQGQVPASGSAMAYIRAHVQESRDCYSCKAEDLTYTGTASALGRITAFNKEMSYSSQVVGPLPTTGLL